MASIPNDILDDALKNRAILPSWKSVFTRLQVSPEQAAAPLTTYLSSPAQLKTLSQPHEPFPSPSHASKQSFESKTAAINFDSTDPTGPLPPINDLKEEALELSNKLNIDELGALRIVIIEYQSRASVALINSSTTSADGSAGGLFSKALDERPTRQEDNKETPLRRRIAIYLSERRYIIKTAGFLVRSTLVAKCAWNDVGKLLLQKINPVDVPVGIIQAVRRGLVEGGGELPSWISEIAERDSNGANKLFFEWEKQILLESIHFMQFLFILLYRPIKPNGATVMAWMKLMKDTYFLYQLHTLEHQNVPEIVTFAAYLKPLCSILSLTMLSFHEVDKYLAIEFLGPSPTRISSGVAFSDDQFYLKSHNTIKLITETLEENALNPVACLATFCWSMILRRISEYLIALGLEFENEPQAIQSVDPCTPEQSRSALARPRERTTGNTTADFFNKALREAHMESSQGLGISAFLAKCAVVDCKLFDLLVELVTSGGLDMHGVKSWNMAQEEDGKRMKAVLSVLVRKATDVVSFSQQLLAATLVVTDVSLREAADRLRSASIVKMDEDGRVEDTNDQSSDERLAALLSEVGNSKLSTDVVSQWWEDKQDLFRLLNPARSRFPYEPLPFLKLVRALATDGYQAYEFLSRIPTYTQVLPPNFQGYGGGSVSSFDEDPTVIYLEEELCLFAPRELSAYDDENDFGAGGIILPPGTKGRVISESASAPIVVMWQYEFNAITLFGRILECALTGSSAGGTRVGAGLLDDSGHRSAVIEIIAILTLLLQSMAASPPKSGNGVANGQSGNRREHVNAETILREASDATAPNRDVVSVIFELLEEELQNASRGLTKDMEYAATALQFVDALLSVMPQRVWPYLARSCLLDKYGNSGALMNISSGIDVTNAEYGFTITALRLFDELVEESLRGSAAYAYVTSSTNGGNALTLRRTDNGLAGVSGAVQREILEGWTKWAVDVFESYRGWRYASLIDKLDIGKRISNIFRKLLKYVYGVDDSPNLENKVTSVLAASASHLTKVFLQDGSNLQPIQPIIGALVDAITAPDTSLFINTLNGWVDHVAAILRFGTSLVRVRAYLELPPSSLEAHLFTASQLIAKSYAIHDRLKLPAIDLLDGMIVASIAKSATSGTTTGKQEPEPPSLLGHLGNDCATSLMHVLANRDSPAHDIDLEIHIWKFVSAIVSNKQQGMSILILRGETFGIAQERSATKLSEKSKNNKSRSILKIALDELSNISKLEPKLALAILETVALTQNHWSLAMEDVGRHPNFLASLMSYMKDFNVEYTQKDDKSLVTKKAITIAIAAFIAQIFAMYLYSNRANGNNIGSGNKGADFVTKLVACSKYYFVNGVNLSGMGSLDGYNPSLHGNLAKNFEMKWPGLTLQRFKKTKLRRREYGMEFFYDVKLADKMLSYESAWSPPDGKGYREEFELANVNMSVFDSKVELLRAWKLLAVELTNYISMNKALGEALVVVIESCLKTNSNTWNLPTHILTLIISERAEFAFVVMRRVEEYYSSIDAGPSPLEEEDRYDIVLDLVWKSIRSQRFDFRKALSSGDVSYYRPYLRIIYMALLDKSKRKDQHPIETCYKVLDMLDLVVAQGFTDLAIAAHTHPERSSPQDIALVTGILQAAMSFGGIEVTHNNLALHIAENDSIRAAITLFSWAEKIASGMVPGTESELRNSVLAFSTNGHNKFWDTSAEGLYGDPVYGELAILFLLELSKIPIIANQMATEGTLERLLNTSLASRVRSMNMGLLNPIHYPRLHAIWQRGLLPMSINITLGIGPRVAEEVMLYLRYFGALIERLVDGWKWMVRGAVSGNVGSGGGLSSPNLENNNIAITLSVVKEAQAIVLVVEILKSMGVSTGGEVTVAIDLGSGIGALPSTVTATTTATASTPSTEKNKTLFLGNTIPLSASMLMDIDNVLIPEKPAYGSLIKPTSKPPPPSSRENFFDALHYRPSFSLDKSGILEAVEYLLSHKNYLVSLVTPTSADEEVEAYTPAEENNGTSGRSFGGGGGKKEEGLSKLAKKVIEEMELLRSILIKCLEGDGEDMGGPKLT